MPNWGVGALLASGAPVTIPRDPAREAAKQELTNPVYHRDDPSLLDRVLNWLGEQLDELFAGLGHPFSGSTAGVVTGVIVALLAVGALWWRLGAPRRQARTTGSLFTARGPRTADQHRADAADHAAAGRWGDAVREQMRAVIRALEERALLDPRPGRTADEAATEAGRTLPAHAAALTAAARTFDDIAFGERTADQAAYQSLVDLDRTLTATRPTLATAGGGAA